MTDTSKKPTGRTKPREKFWDMGVTRMSPDQERKIRRELGGTRIRFIPKRPKPPEAEEDS
jgi:hypothetical protein